MACAFFFADPKGRIRNSKTPCTELYLRDSGQSIARTFGLFVLFVLKFRDTIGDFGALLYCGHDWVAPKSARRSMELMATQVMLRVNAAIGKM